VRQWPEKRLKSRVAKPLARHGATLVTMERFKRGALPPSESSLGYSSHSRLRVGPRVEPKSGEHALRYALVREVLLGYLSPILVDSVLHKAMTTRRLSPDKVTPAELAEVTSDIMVGLRLFVAEERLPQLMLELAEVLEHGQ